MKVRNRSLKTKLKKKEVYMGEATREKRAYGMKRIVDVSFDEALTRTREALKGEGFGVLTEIDMKEKFQEKLGKGFRNYVILGACNPKLAFEALGKDIDIGLLLPCNVVVYETEGQTAVAVIDAEKAMSVTGSTKVEPIAKQVNEKLSRALNAI